MTWLAEGTFIDVGNGTRTFVDSLKAPHLYRRDVAQRMVVPDRAVSPQGQSVGGAAAVRDQEGRRLVVACLAGDAAARMCFQQRFGPLIYRFVRVAGAGTGVEGGDFYVYLFEEDRLYRRLRSFEGRASLEAFLRGFVLPDLWKRFSSMVRKESIETISLDNDYEGEPPAPFGRESDDQGDRQFGGDLFRELSPDKRLLIKLLYIEDFDLDADDVRLLAERSGRGVREVVELVERARESVRTREQARQQKLDEAASAAQWILQYERRAAQIAEQLAGAVPGAAYAARLRAEQAELARKRAWREQQRERARTAGEGATVTLRYRDIAFLMNAPTGSVSTQIMRLRRELLARVAADGKVASDSSTEHG